MSTHVEHTLILDSRGPEGKSWNVLERSQCWIFKYFLVKIVFFVFLSYSFIPSFNFRNLLSTYYVPSIQFNPTVMVSSFNNLLKVKVLVAQQCLDSLWPCGLEPTRLLCPCDSLGKNTSVGCHSLLQGIFPTQRLIDSRFPVLQADSLLTEPPWKPLTIS